MIKVIATVKRKKGVTLEEFSKHWYEKHVAVGRATIPNKLMHKKYIQNHAFVLSGNGEPPYDGVAEIYFDDQAALRRWSEWYFSDDAKALRDDEESFIDVEKTVVVVTEEREIKLLCDKTA